MPLSPQQIELVAEGSTATKEKTKNNQPIPVLACKRLAQVVCMCVSVSGALGCFAIRVPLIVSRVFFLPAVRDHLQEQ